MTEKPKDKREAILKASLQIFAENGFHGSPTSQISKMANVGTGTIYRYFENKDALIEALHEELEESLLPLGEVIEEDLPVRENLFRYLQGVFRYLLDNPCYFRFLEQFYNSPYGVAKQRAKADKCDKPIWALLERGIERQIIKDMPKEVLFSLCFGPMLMLIRDHLNGYFELTEAMVDATLCACWDSVKL